MTGNKYHLGVVHDRGDQFTLCLRWLMVYGDRRLPWSHPVNRGYVAQAKREAFRRDGLLVNDVVWLQAWDTLATMALSNGWVQ